MLKSKCKFLSTKQQRIALGCRTLIMGVLNVSPDSFSGDGLADCSPAVELALSLEKSGADIIDIGAESTRPGFQPVNAEEEGKRLFPVLENLSKKLSCLLSVDTRKASVFRQAAQMGASIFNSTAGPESELMELAAELGTPFVIMHNGPGSCQNRYDKGVLTELLHYLEDGAARALSAGLKEDQIILDPGIGFAKNADDNLAILRSLKQVCQLGFTSMIGTSRKSTIGKVTGQPVSERVYGTAATVALAIAAGVDIVRVHDVSAMLDVVRMSDAIVRDWRPEGWQQ